MEGDLKERIASDFKSFYAARETYAKYGIPWKRGVLLLGPPGNGKTHCIKGLINMLQVPCIYVRTFQSQHHIDSYGMKEVFTQARKQAPCLVVLEDLDSLLNVENRSFFLNELDGFAANEGVMVVATTNHPERLDPALLERPSRFDRKYNFNLPNEDCRSRFLTRFSQDLEPELQLSESQASQIASSTEAFSFAYLRELFLSAMMAWVHKPDRPFYNVMVENIETLRAQMHSSEPEAPDSNGSLEELSRMSRQARRRYKMTGRFF